MAEVVGERLGGALQILQTSRSFSLDWPAGDRCVGLAIAEECGVPSFLVALATGAEWPLNVV